MESVKLPNNNNFDTNGSSESEQISGDGENEKLLDYSTVNDETVATMSNDEKNGNYEKIDYSDKSRSASPRPGRRSDEPVELSFEKRKYHCGACYYRNQLFCGGKVQSSDETTISGASWANGLAGLRELKGQNKVQTVIP